MIARIDRQWTAFRSKHDFIHLPSARVAWLLDYVFAALYDANSLSASRQRYKTMHIIWIIIIGFIAGVIAKLVTPGENEPQGFILTTILGIIGAFVATYLGQAIGWYTEDQGAGLIGATVGAVLILLVWGFIERRKRAP